MTTALIKKTYQVIVPTGARERFWELRQGGLTSRMRARLYARFKLRCHVCHSRQLGRHTNPIIARLPYDFYRCRECDFIFVYPPPDTSEYYAQGEVIEMGGAEPLWNSSFLDAVENQANERGRLLEIGFGDADFLRLAHERGWEVHGAELSRECVRHASEDLGLPNMKYGTVEEIAYPSDYFDAIAAFNFIEHVPDPRATLAELRRILAPGGLLALLCPNMTGLYHEILPDVFGDEDPLNISWVPPAHLSYFNRSNFKRLLEACGFELVADESAKTTPLWLQHELSIGPKITSDSLAELHSGISSSPRLPGEPHTAEFRERIKEVLLRRMAWSLVTGVMELEGALGAECAILYISRKPAL